MEMNSPLNPTSSQLPVGSGQKPGERLRQVRVAQKREIAEVASALNIPARHLHALENDDYRQLPEPPFIRGYLRGYARVLGVDGNALVTRFDELYQEDTGQPLEARLSNSPLRPMGKLRARDRKASVRWLVLLVGLLGLLTVGLLAYQLLNHWLHRTPAAPSADVATVEAAPSAPTTLAIDTPDTTTALDQMVIDLNAPAEVQVKDGTGKVLVSGLHSPDQPVRLQGSSPFEILLPNATAVRQLQLNGEVVDIRPYTVDGQANFRLTR